MRFNKNVFNKVKLRLMKITFIILCLLPNFVNAVETQLKKETTLFNQTFSWQIMMGVSIYSSQNPLKGVEQTDAFDYLSLLLMIDLYYEGFFIQSNHHRSIGATQSAEIGYQLYVDDDWTLDIISKNYINGYDPEYLIENNKKNIPTLEGLNERDIGSAIALRYSYFNDDDSILSVDLAKIPEWESAKGWLIDIYYNELFIYKNWDIYIGGGATYYSNQVMNYYYGVSESEANDVREFYKPSAGFKATFEIYAQYPISKKWSFNAGVNQTYYSDAIGRSPLIDKQNITQFLLGAIYVF